MKEEKIAVMNDKRVVLSTLWIVLVLNYLYCDLLGLMDPHLLPLFMEGNVGGIHITPGFLLGAAVLMEIPIAMILLSRVLDYKVNRPTNIIAGILMAAVQFSSLFFGTHPSVYYIFFSIVEIALLLFIVRYAWKWRNPSAVK